MIAAVILIGMTLFSLSAFTALGLIGRWSLRLSLAYAGTMTAFLAAIAGVCALLTMAIKP